MVKILIVDDSKMITDLIKEIVEKKGFLAFTATDSGEAFAIFEKEKPDLVFLDILLSENNKDGIYSLKEMKSINPEVKVAMVTSLVNQEDVEKRCNDLGAKDYITKPFKTEEIEKVLDKYFL